jgi:hypothetical protein
MALLLAMNSLTDAKPSSNAFQCAMRHGIII